ncbi:MAG: T9SS type A sorting domain-containing protein [Bacteroidetes bacterium]|nr:T9SS type A sorting domain-containing protein [Bacteroidota bacterium]
MKKITFAWLLLSVLITAFSSVAAQTPIEKYFPTGSKSFGFGSAGQLPGGGYFAVGNADMFDHNEFSVWRLNEKGDSIKMKKYFPKTPHNQNNRWTVSAVVASDGGLFILTSTWDFNGGGQFTYNSVMRTNAQGDSTWCVIISPQDAWAGAKLYDIVATPDGGCIVAGQSNWSDNPRLVKISSTGAITWEAVISSSGRRFNSVCLTSDGAYIATGGGQVSYTEIKNLLVAKFTDAGATVWSKTFYSGLFETGDKRKAEGLSVTATADGGCMLAGYVTNPGMWGSSALLMRMNASGDSLWTKKYYPWKDPNEPAKAYNLVRLPSDQYLMYLHKNTSTSPEATIVKLNSSGDSLWTQIGYNHQMRMMNRTDSEGGILLTGTTMGANYNENIAVFIRTTSGGMYKSPELMTPFNGYTGIDMIPTLEWRGSPWSGGPFHKPSSFRVQVARDSAFTNIVYDKSSVTSTKQQVTKLLPLTKYIWRVQSVGKEGSPTKWSPVFSFTTGVSTKVETIDGNVPLSFSLKQNYPNPFNPSSTIEFSIPKSTHVNVTIFNTLGKEINILLNSCLSAGKHTVVFDGNNLPSGVYFYRLTAGSFSQTRKMVYLK